HRARLVHRRDQPRFLRRAPPPPTLDRRDDLNVIHRHVANLVLATCPTQLSPVHKAADLGGVRSGRGKYARSTGATSEHRRSSSPERRGSPPTGSAKAVGRACCARSKSPSLDARSRRLFASMPRT